jgi:hypothetical protein
MCLKTIKTRAEDMPFAMVAKKRMYEPSTGRWLPWHMSSHLPRTLKIGDSIGVYDDYGTIETDDGQQYVPGIHAWPLEEDTPEANMLVLLRGPICAGIDAGRYTVVYRECILLGVPPPLKERP